MKLTIRSSILAKSHLEFEGEKKLKKLHLNNVKQTADQLLYSKLISNSSIVLNTVLSCQKVKSWGELLTLCNDMRICTCMKQEVESACLRIPLKNLYNPIV